MIGKQKYDLLIDASARMMFNKDLKKIKGIAKTCFNGKITRDKIAIKIKDWQDYEKAKEICASKRFFGKVLLKQMSNAKIYPDRDICRLILGLMDLLAQDDILPEYIDEFLKYEEDFYYEFKDIYEYRARVECPYSKYMDSDRYFD